MSTSPTNARRAVLYLRLSVTTDESTSIQRQEQDLRALAAREGWEIVQVLTDDGISGGKQRDNAELALTMIREDRADVLAVWKLDRFGRRGVRDVAAIADALDARADSTPGRPALFVAISDGLRSDVAMWEIIASLYAGQAKQERLNTMARVKSARDFIVRGHKYAGGNLPFGYRTAPAPDGKGRILEINPETAPHVRWLVQHITDGGSLYSGAQYLNAQGIKTTRGNRWNGESLRVFLTGDAILGRVTHRGALLRDADGVPVTVWPPLTTPEESARIRARFPPFSGDKTASPRNVKASRILSRLLVCASCGATLHAGQSNQVRHTGSTGKNSVRKVRYICSSGAGRCPTRVTIDADTLDKYVVDEFLAVVGNLEVIATHEEAQDLGEKIVVEEALATVAREMTEPGADIPALLDRLTGLRARREALEAMPTAPVRVTKSTGRTYREIWNDSDGNESTTLIQRRELLAGALTGPIVVAKHEPGTSRRPGARATIPWRWLAPELDETADYDD